MTIQISAGLANTMLASGSAKSVLDGGKINIYSGSAPTNADAAVTGTLLCTVTVSSGGTGLSFDVSASAGVLAKAPAATWSGVNAATGTAGYFRHVSSTDTGASGTTQPRIQGTVGTVGADLNLTSTSLTSGATQTVDYYTVALPIT